LESSPNGRWRPNHQIEREAGRNAPADSRGLFGRRARMRHDDQKIHVRITMRISGCMRPEKNDASRRKLVDDLLHVVSNLLGRDHSLNLGKACNRSRRKKVTATKSG